MELIIGISASVLTAIASFPQLIKIIKEKEAENISLAMFSVLVVGLALWIYYGILKDDLILIVSNGISFIINVIVLILAIKYKGVLK